MNRTSNHLEDRLLDLVLRGEAYAAPAAVYAGLLTALVEADDGATWSEPAGGTYARQAVSFAAAAGGAMASSAAIEFPQASEAWGTLTHLALFDASAGGHVLFWAPLPAPRAIGAGEAFGLGAGRLRVSLGGGLSPALADRLLERVLRAAAWAPLAGLYAGLLTAYAGATSFAEVDGGGYARAAASFGRATAGMAIAAPLTFPAASAAWGTVTHLALFDAAEAGELLWAGPLRAPRTAGAGAAVRFAGGELRVRFD